MFVVNISKCQYIILFRVICEVTFNFPAGTFDPWAFHHVVANYLTQYFITPNMDHRQENCQHLSQDAINIWKTCSSLGTNVMKLHTITTFVNLANTTFWEVVLQIMQLLCSAALLSDNKYTRCWHGQIDQPTRNKKQHKVVTCTKTDLWKGVKLGKPW